MNRFGGVCVLLGACLSAGSCSAGHRPAALSIAAAADLKFAMEEMVREYERSSGGPAAEVVYGSSGNFYSQIRNGAPFDVFLSADVEYPRRLAAEGHARADSIFEYAVGRLAVWVPAQSALDPATALQQDWLKHVAIANPQHAPYGRAAEAALRSMGLYEKLKNRLVLGENIAQTLQFVESGAAEAGIVALSLASAPTVQGKGRYWEVPLDRYPTMAQGGIILKDSAAARGFREWVLSARGREILRRYGFYLPG